MANSLKTERERERDREREKVNDGECHLGPML